MLTSTSFKS